MGYSVLTEDIGRKILDLLFDNPAGLTLEELALRTGVKDTTALLRDIHQMYSEAMMDPTRGGIGGTRLGLVGGPPAGCKMSDHGEFTLFDINECRTWQKALELAGPRGLTLDELHMLLAPQVIGWEWADGMFNLTTRKHEQVRRDRKEKQSKHDVQRELAVFVKGGAVRVNLQGRYVWGGYDGEGMVKADVADVPMLSGPAALIAGVLLTEPPGSLRKDILKALSDSGIKRSDRWLMLELEKMLETGQVEMTGQKRDQANPPRYWRKPGV